MLPRVDLPVNSRSLEEYRSIIRSELAEEIEQLAAELQGRHVAMVNATPQGGGVAEILHSLIPLLNGLGVQAEWYVIPPNERFFELTKRIHNGLQGHEVALSEEDKALYHEHTEKTAELMTEMNPDVWVLHDPQPAGIGPRLRSRTDTPLVSRVHIDTTEPHPPMWSFIHDFLQSYDRVIFHSREFVHSDVPEEQRVIFPPAIDPLSEKNTPLDQNTARSIVAGFGIDPDRPLLVQVSRFDPWKDPVGVIQAYRAAKEYIPDLQLAYVGLILADDDPEAARVLEEAKQEAANDPDIFLFSNPNVLGDMSVDRFVNAFQTAADVVTQKSIREGFGLVVAEAMWKGKAVIGGNAGGIRLQLEHGKNGFLVSTPEEAAERIVELIRNEDTHAHMRSVSTESARERYLMPRLARDYLALFRELL